MNPDTNRFEPETEATPKEWMRLSVGEEIVIRDYVFRVESITPDSLGLSPQRKASRQQRRHPGAARIESEIDKLKAMVAGLRQKP